MCSHTLLCQGEGAATHRLLAVAGLEKASRSLTGGVTALAKCNKIVYT